MERGNVDGAVTHHLGTYHASVSWAIRHGASAEQVARIVEERCSSGGARMIGRTDLWVRDKEDWWPDLVAACARMIDDAEYPPWVDGGPVAGQE